MNLGSYYYHWSIYYKCIVQTPIPRESDSVYLHGELVTCLSAKFLVVLVCVCVCVGDVGRVI